MNEAIKNIYDFYEKGFDFTKLKLSPVLFRIFHMW